MVEPQDSSDAHQRRQPFADAKRLTGDQVSITMDGRRLDSPGAVIAFVAQTEAERSAEDSEEMSAFSAGPSTVAGSVDQLRSWLVQGDFQKVRHGLLLLFDRLQYLDAGAIVARCAHPPASTGHDGVDAAVASVVEHTLASLGRQVPEWVMRTPPAAEPFHVYEVSPALRALVQAGTPDAFRRRNVFVPVEYFQRPRTHPEV